MIIFLWYGMNTFWTDVYISPKNILSNTNEGDCSGSQVYFVLIPATNSLIFWLLLC